MTEKEVTETKLKIERAYERGRKDGIKEASTAAISFITGSQWIRHVSRLENQLKEFVKKETSRTRGGKI